MGLTFTPVVDALASTTVVSASSVVSGLTLGTKTIQIVGTGELSIDGGGWVGSGVVQNGSAVRLRTTTPAGELGQVTTVTVDLQSVGYVTWSVTNRDTLMAESGAGYGDVLTAVVTPLPLEDFANAYDEIFGSAFLFAESSAVGFDTLIGSLTAGATVNESGNGTGAGFVSPTVLVDEVATGADTLLGTLVFSITEYGAGADVLLATLAAQAAVFETGSGKDTIVTQSAVDMVDEVGAGADVLLGGLRVAVTVTDDSGVGYDELVEAGLASAMVEEIGNALDTLLPRTTVTVNYDNVGYGFDEPLVSTPTRAAWVFNARTMAMTRWEGMPIAEVHEANGVVYGMAEDGAYILSSVQAADAMLESGLYDFGVIETKRLRLIYLTYTASSPLHVGVVRSNGGGKQRLVYGKSAYYAENPVQTRILLGRGPVARYWGFTLSNTDGGFASVKDLQLVPNVTTRRV